MKPGSRGPGGAVEKLSANSSRTAVECIGRVPGQYHLGLLLFELGL